MWHVSVGHLVSLWKEYLPQKSRYRLVGSPCVALSFFKLQEGKSSYFLLIYFCFEGKFQAIFAKVHQKMDCKARKVFKDTPGVPLKFLYHRYDTPYSHRKNKSKIKDFSKNRTLKAKSITKMQRRFWWKNTQKWRKSQKSSQKCRKTILYPQITSRSNMESIQIKWASKNENVVPPTPYSDVLDAASLNVDRKSTNVDSWRKLNFFIVW